jgi:hypothetical protein
MTRIALLAALVAAPLAAQQPAAVRAAPPPIRDNSFLVEEAYNQEARVVQHISALSLTRESTDWEYGFTQEWPVRSQRHQLSVTVPILHAAQTTAVGDLAINYRYQLAFDDLTGNAIAPRVSLVLPTGDSGAGQGTSSLGVQVNLPVSWGWHRSLVTHWNLGGAWTPAARALLGGRATTRDAFASASMIWLATASINLMLEAAWAREESAVGDDTREAGESAFISPGLRAAINVPSGLQIVPGIAFPIGVGPSDGQRRVFVYLSLEHSF